MSAHDALELKGSVERVRFYNEHSGFVILKLSQDDASQSMMLLGYATTRPQEGQMICARGHKEMHPQFGEQFVADEPIIPVLPQSKEGLIKWFASGAIPGVGAVWAKRLVDHFGPDILDILTAQPERLSEIEALGQKRQTALRTAISDHTQQLKVASYMATLGLGPKRTQTLLSKYGLGIVQLLQEHPYRLYRENHGIGFLLADDIARRNGLPETSDERLLAALYYVLEEQSASGHCYGEVEEVVARLRELLGYEVTRLRVQALSGQHEDFFCEEGKVALQSVVDAERRCAMHVLRLARVPLPPERVRMQQDALDALLTHSQVALTDEQIMALRLALSHRVTVITGGPGVGKTTVTRALLRTFETLGRKVCLAAPTGRAAKRLKESTGREAQTVHRLLKYDPASSSFAFHERQPLKVDVLILDEMSMVDVHLMGAVLAALPTGSCCVMVGDQDQLPSVGVGAVLADIMRSGVIPVAKLTQIFRQARYSKIIQTAHRIRQGQMPVSDPESDCVWHRTEGPEEVVACLNELLMGGGLGILGCDTRHPGVDLYASRAHWDQGLKSPFKAVAEPPCVCAVCGR